MTSSIQNTSIQRTVAVVSQPGMRADEMLTRLEREGHEDLRWRALPAIHMLGRNTDDERATYDYLLGRTEQGPAHYPDGILVFLSAGDLDRQMYLVSQLIDLRLPILIAVTDRRSGEEQGLVIHEDKLATQLGVNVVVVDDVQADAPAVIRKMERALDRKSPRRPMHWRPSVALANAYNLLDRRWIYDHLKLHAGARLIEGLRLLSVEKAAREYEHHTHYEALIETLDEARGILEKRKENWVMAEVLQRHTWIGQVVTASTTRRDRPVEKPAPWWRKMWDSFQS